MEETKSKNHNHSPFRYFHNPHTYHPYSKGVRECGICHQNYPGYEAGGLYGDCKEINFICENCLIKGKLKEIECKTNWGNPGALRKQLENSLQLIRPFPQPSEEEIRKLVKERTEEIEYRTPKIISWQSFDWPVHCGDYCCFIGEMGKEELNELSSDKNGRILLDTVIFDMPRIDSFEEKDMTKKRLDWIHKEATEYLDWLWEYIPSHSPKKKSDPCSSILLFQCFRCNNYLAILDFD